MEKNIHHTIIPNVIIYEKKSPQETKVRLCGKKEMSFSLTTEPKSCSYAQHKCIDFPKSSPYAQQTCSNFPVQTNQVERRKNTTARETKTGVI